jgi:hypothetical protein
MRMRPRRAQAPVNIRSDKAASILARHVRPGRSQAVVVEEALEKMDGDQEFERFMAKIRDIQERAARTPPRFASMAEFDAHEYDERGNLR